MPRRENLSEDKITKLLSELDEEWKKDSSESLYCSEDDGKTGCVLDSLGSESSDDKDIKVILPPYQTNESYRTGKGHR
ncbi:Hypothetical predicted protein [Octopus vulgaris]|uniref:Uncharacterized protein n=1 Tax=Octopus vulgaris TaxID=6645 RepID=A0AA36FBA0_OCTVU|nr:Hypothetical predicted protein [Octopus vulgaris]